MARHTLEQMKICRNSTQSIIAKLKRDLNKVEASINRLLLQILQEAKLKKVGCKRWLIHLLA